jgi:hypothetical protein
MKKWTRWQDWVALAVGAYAALSPIWTDRTDTATWTMVVLGVVIAGVSLWSLAMPADRVSEYLLAILGVLFILAPWVMEFTELEAMALTAWIAGAITFIMGAMTIPEVNRLWHHAPSH